MKLYDHLGQPWTEPIPDVKSAKWMRSVYYKGQARVGDVDKDGLSTSSPIREELVRAQVPWCVVLLIYESKYQVDPVRREYFLHCPMEMTQAAKMAMRLWQRWERPPRPEFNFEDMRDVYPKVGEGIMAEPMQESDYDEHWRDVKSRPHHAVGDPEDPWAFTCLDEDVKLYKQTDFQHGLDVKIT